MVKFNEEELKGQIDSTVKLLVATIKMDYENGVPLKDIKLAIRKAKRLYCNEITKAGVYNALHK